MFGVHIQNMKVRMVTFTKLHLHTSRVTEDAVIFVAQHLSSKSKIYSLQTLSNDFDEGKIKLKKLQNVKHTTLFFFFDVFSKVFSTRATRSVTSTQLHSIHSLSSQFGK